MTAALHAISQLASLRLIDSLFGGACIGLFAALVLRFARRQSSAIRFAICFSALIGIAILPFFCMSAHASGKGHAAIALPESWALYFFMVWAVITGFGLLRLGRALHRLRHIRHACVPISPQTLHPLVQSTFASHNLDRRVTLCTSDRVRVPTAIGLLKPTIVIPQWVMQDLSPEELSQILLHELAHLRRWDDWTNLAQQLVKALFFFHPAVWWFEKRITLEREMACDDAVLAVTSSPRAYAACLARLAESSLFRHGVALAQAALGKLRDTSLRVAQILNVDRRVSSARSWKPASSLVAVFTITCGIAVSRAPNLIAFQDSRPSEVATAAIPAGTNSGPALNLAHAANFKVPSHSQRTLSVIPANITVRPQDQRSQARLLKVKAPSRASHTRAVHLTSLHENVVSSTETLFFVVEDMTEASGQQVYRVQLLRVIVFHPAGESAGHAPAKQT